MEDIKKSIKELVESQKKTEEVMREVAEAQKVNEAARQKTEVAHQKTKAAQQKTEASQQKTEKSLRDFRIEMAQALGEIQKGDQRGFARCCRRIQREVEYVHGEPGQRGFAQSHAGKGYCRP